MGCLLSPVVTPFGRLLRLLPHAPAEVNANALFAPATWPNSLSNTAPWAKRRPRFVFDGAVFADFARTAQSPCVLFGPGFALATQSL